MRFTTLFIALAICGGCEARTGIRINVDSDRLDFESDFEEIRFDIMPTAERDTSTGSEACTIRLNTERRDLEFPFSLVIYPGEQSWSCIGLRVTGTQDDVEVIQAFDYFCPNFEGVYEETIWLNRDCHAELGSVACEDGLVCEASESDDARCIGSPTGSLFDEEPGNAECEVVVP